MTQHTPTPWMIVEEPYRHIRSASGECVWADDFKPDANAALIVCAVNAHEKLLAAAEAALKRFRSPVVGEISNADIEDQLSTAIAAAKEGA